MRNVLLLALLVPAMVLAVPKTQTVTAIAPETGVVSNGPITRVDGNGQPGEPRALIGMVDTIGGTTYDWQANGPAYRMLVNSPDYGLHALWMYSASDDPTFPDRNMRYNFYDYAAGAWNWIDPDFMQSGVNVYTDRNGYGNLDADPATGVAIVSCHIGDPIHPDIARDMAPGAGIFEYCTGSPTADGYLWPYLSVDANSKIHIHCIDDASRNMVYYTAIDPWCTYSTPVGVAAPQPDPNFCNQNIAASKVSNKVALAWEFSEGAPDPGFYRISTDGGSSWENPEELPWPQAYGGDTATSYHITSMFPYWDMNDMLHIVATVQPFVAGTGYIWAQIWHWSPDQTPNWTHIHTGQCDPANLGAAVGYNALYACRASMGEDADGNLFIAWEEFDSLNVETGPPEVLRADIFVAGSGDGGMTWGAPVKLTEGGTGSHRFPSIVDMAFDDGTDVPVIGVVYEIDQVAGFFVQGENIATNNPIIFHCVPTSEIPTPGGGVNEGGRLPRRVDLTATPNPFGGRTVISYALPQASAVRLTIHDASGRPVRTLENCRRDAGQYRVAWDGRAGNGEKVAAGIYFYTLTTDEASVSQKLTVVR
jgi:hypothetical protein